MFQKRDILLPNHRFINRNYEKFLLVGDIGGTNLRLAMVAMENKSPVLLFINFYSTKDIKDISEPINDTLKYADEHYLITTDTAILSAAGLLSKDKRSVKLTLVSLDVSVDALLKKTLLKNIALLNDFEALGYGVSLCKNVYLLNQAKKSGESVAVIGAGTGLGVVLVVDGKVVPSEAGHMDLAVETPEEYKLLEFMKKKTEHVDFCAIVSGSGLVNLYEFYSGKKVPYSSHKAMEITENAGKDPAAKKAVEAFVRFYGRFAGNIAMVNMPRGGLYIAGGITPYIVSHMKSDFLKEFENRLFSSTLKEEVPVYIINDHHLALLGCAVFFLKKPLGYERPQITEEDAPYKEKLEKQEEFKPWVRDKPPKDFFEKEPPKTQPTSKPEQAEVPAKPVVKPEEKKEETKAITTQPTRALAEK